MRTKIETNLSLIWGLLIRITLVVGLAYFMWRVRSILIGVILAAMLAYVLLPAVDFIARHRFLRLGLRTRRLIASVIVFVLFFALVGAAVGLLFSPFQREAKNLIDSMAVYSKQIKADIDSFNAWYKANLPDDLQRTVGDLNYQPVLQAGGTFLSGAIKGTFDFLGKIVEIVLIPVLAFYFVLDSRSLKREFVGMLPPWRAREALKLLRKVSLILQSYVVGQLILCVIAGLVTGIVLNILNMPYVLVLAVFAGITRAIPIIGPVVSGIPICILGAMKSPGLGLGLLIFVVVMHFVESKFIMPILIGERMRLHPAVILIVLLIGAEFFGLLGMFLAAPVAAIVRELINFYIVVPRRKRLLTSHSRRHNGPNELMETENV